MAEKNIYLVEGKTEERFFSLFKNKLKHIGKIKIFNITEKSLSSDIRGFRYDNVFFVFDYDVLENPKERDTILKKIEKSLKQVNAKNKHLIVQFRDFEDELISGSKEIKNFNELKKYFNCNVASKNEFKTHFLGIREEPLKQKLDCIDFKKLYTKINQQDNVFPHHIRNKIKSGEQIFSIKKS